VISRAGALSVSELCLAGKPAVLVPFPGAAEDHQTKNAMSLVSKEAALLVADNRVNELLMDTCLRLVNDQEQQRKLSGSIRAFARPEAAKDIVNEIKKIIEK
jgi:UDP-N-acetylglucosamine--N-acetylmuramyl-(pentapeptide) pyrophosphoryl-undecaprenol N-acetylglucosamine transferase